jgi:uncharacterized DUF497 family protein
MEMDDLDFEWDPEKDRENQAKHGLAFDEAETLFTSGVDYLDIYDVEHSEEDRFIAIGPIARGVVVVVYTDRPDRVRRLISARPATPTEEELFLRSMSGEGS